MARYAISPEGAEGLRTLSETLKQSLSAAVDANKGLQNTIADIMESLGVYGLEIWGITLRVKDMLDSAMEEIDTLAESLQNKANEIEELVLSTAAGGTIVSSISGITKGNLLLNQQANKSMRMAGKEWANSLGTNEKSAINDYTKECPPYYRNINGVLIQIGGRFASNPSLRFDARLLAVFFVTTQDNPTKN